MGKYFLIVLDKNGNVVAVYPGSSTARAGMGSRWFGSFDHRYSRNITRSLQLDVCSFKATAAWEFFALQWTARLRPTVTTRIQLARSITATEVEESAFCLGFWRFYTRLDAEQYIGWCNAHITLMAQAVLGLPIETGKEFLHLPPAENHSMLREMGAYWMWILDEKGNLIGWYAGFGTTKEERGMFQRWTEGYDIVVDNARRGVRPTVPFYLIATFDS
jgi:hypothetical protein